MQLKLRTRKGLIALEKERTGEPLGMLEVLWTYLLWGENK